jgi:hypothetical protein
MEKNKLLRIVLPFIVGAGFGFGVWALYSFTQSPPGTDPAPVRLSVADAHIFAQNYYNGATTPTAKFKAFTIDKTALSALNTLQTGVSTATAFRIYLAKDASGAQYFVCCGVDVNGSDITGSIYGAKSTKVGPCPDVCDVNSPVSPQ